MYLNDLNSSRHNVDKLNKILSRTFEHDVDLSEMSTDSLNRMLTTTNAKMTAIKESDLKYWENPQYNKLGLIAHQIKEYLSEIAPTRTDGKKMKTKESTVMEADLDQAEVLLAAQELVDELQGMVEDVAEMQVQKLMPIVDAMKEQVGFDIAEQYNSAADGALGTLLDAMKSAKEAVENATLAARGEPVNTPAPTDMGMDAEAPMDAEANMDMPTDEFGGDDAEAGEDNPVGRELKGESALADMEKGALAEKKFMETKDKLFKMVESGKMTQEHFINVITELTAKQKKDIMKMWDPQGTGDVGQDATHKDGLPIKKQYPQGGYYMAPPKNLGQVDPKDLTDYIRPAPGGPGQLPMKKKNRPLAYFAKGSA